VHVSLEAGNAMYDLAVSTRSLTKDYSATRAVDSLSLHVPRGTVYGFLGRNGAGKTTTMKILLGLVRPTSGFARVLELDILSHRREILERTSFVSESKRLYDSFTTEQLIRFRRGFYGNWSSQVAEDCARALEIPMTQQFRKLSHGNRTKVCMLLAMAQGAELLILDEPTTGLDPVAIERVLKLFVEQQRGSGRTIFFSSHQLSEVDRVAEWVGIIDRGRLVLEERLDEIRAKYRLVSATGNSLPAQRTCQVISVTESSGEWSYLVTRDADRFAAELCGQGARVVGIAPVGLREVFLHLVGKG